MGLQPVRARLFGSVDLRLGAAPLQFSRRDARGLLLLLLSTPTHRLGREAVLDALWPDVPPDSARNSLYKALHALRRALEPDLHAGRASSFVVVEHDTIGLHPDADIRIDVDHFEALLRQAETAADPRELLRTALDLYRGPLLGDDPRFDWARTRQTALRNRVRQATLRLARIELEHENGIAVIGRLHAFLEDDPFDEDMQRVLLRAYSSSGQHIAAREHLAWTREFFEQELGVSFDIDDDEIAPAPSVLSGHRAHTPAYGLPGLPGETIGREREIDSIIARLIAPGVREITVLGPGGVGKTRIAIEVAHRALPHFAGGLLWVELFTVQDRELVFAAIGRVLGLAGQAGGLERTLVLAAIRRMGRCLIVLDNLEHLPGVEQYVADLLREAPEARILATSRSPLRIRAEVQIPLGPLPLPSDNSPDSVRRNPAVQLYLRRSADWNGTVEPYSPTELAQVADLCRQLDGLPLAIELAASRSHEIEISEILAQTSSRFALLRDGPVDLPDRQRTLEATVGWSCRLLLDRADEESLEAERIALLVRDRFALPWSALMRSWIAWERGNDRRSIELGALAAERFRDAGDERNEIHALVPIVASLNRLGNSDAVVTVREIARNMIEYPSDIVLALGLTPVAETVWRLRCDERARPMLAGAELAAERAAVPRIGITTRYRNSVKERVESVDRAGAPWPRIEPLAALDLAIAAVADLG